MNIDVKFSKIIRKIEKHYGCDNALKSKYLILKKECDNAGYGIFAYYINFISEIEYALAHNMIPVIDMRSFKSSLHRDGEVGKVNAWETYFEQPCDIGLDEALRSGQARYYWQDIPDFHPNDSLDFLYNDELLEYYHRIATKYIRFHPAILDMLDLEFNRITDGGKRRCIGVLARGTDYAEFKPFYNPIQPSAEQMIPFIRKYMDKYSCEYIFVATEDESILSSLKLEFGDKLLFVNQKRVSGVNDYLYNNAEFMSVDTYDRTLDYLKAIYILSKCAGIVAGRTSGTVGACLMAERYEFMHIFTFGRYGIDDEILSHGVN